MKQNQLQSCKPTFLARQWSQLGFWEACALVGGFSAGGWLVGRASCKEMPICLLLWLVADTVGTAH